MSTIEWTWQGYTNYTAPVPGGNLDIGCPAAGLWQVRFLGRDAWSSWVDSTNYGSLAAAQEAGERRIDVEGNR